jgi:hypothetical protein
VCGTGVEDPNRGVGKPRGGFPCSVVGEAKEDDICASQGLAAGLRFLALFFGKDDDFKILPAPQPVADSKGRGACLTVDVKFGRHSKFFLPESKRILRRFGRLSKVRKLGRIRRFELKGR